MGEHGLAAKLRAALELADTGVALMRQNLHRAHPEETSEQVERRLQEWLERRPGAEHGDCPGKPRQLSDV